MSTFDLISSDVGSALRKLMEAKTARSARAEKVQPNWNDVEGVSIGHNSANKMGKSQDKDRKGSDMYREGILLKRI